MTKKNKANCWQIISAILAALGSLLSSLKRSHDQAHEEESSSPALRATSPQD